jgi:hypothetical protein
VEISEEGRKKLNTMLNLELTFANLQPARQVAGGMETVAAMARAFHTAPGDAFSISEDGKLVFPFDDRMHLCECTFRGPKIETVVISDLERGFTLDLSSNRERSPSPPRTAFQLALIDQVKRRKTDNGEVQAPGRQTSTSEPAPVRSTGDHQTNQYGEMMLPDAAVAGPAGAGEKGKQAASVARDGLPDEGTATTQPPPQPIAADKVICVATFGGLCYTDVARTSKRRSELQHYGYEATAAGLKTVSRLCDAVPAVPLDNGRYVHYEVPLGVTGTLATVVRRLDDNNDLKDLRIVVSNARPGAYVSSLNKILYEMDTSKKLSDIRLAAAGGSASTSAPARAPSTANLPMNEHGEAVLPNAAARPARAGEKGKQAASISRDRLPDEGTATAQPPPQPTAANKVTCVADCTDGKYWSLAKTYKREMELKHYGYEATAADLKKVSRLCDAVPAVPLDNGRYVHYKVPLGDTGQQLATVVRRIEGNNELKDLRIVVSSATPGAYVVSLDSILSEMNTSKKQSAVRTAILAQRREAKQSLGGNGTG